MGRGTDRAFVAFVCRGCTASDGVDVTDAVGAVVRACPLGVMAESQCILGGSPCTMRFGREGVIVAVQPLSPDAPSLARPQVRGPLVTKEDLKEFCSWLKGGSWI
jgi:hypothetical protein